MDREGLGSRPLGSRFCVAYHLRRGTDGARVVLRAFLPDGTESLRSAHGLFKGALWTEREVHEMFGVDFAGSPDQRRLLTPSDFEGFPLRKDFPLRGTGYRENFPRYEGYTPPWDRFPQRELPRAQRDQRLRELATDDFASDGDA